MKQQTSPHPFVTYLEGLAEDRAALAALRRQHPTAGPAELQRLLAERLLGVSLARAVYPVVEHD